MTPESRILSLEERATKGAWGMSYSPSSIGPGFNWVRLMLSRPGMDPDHGITFDHATEHTKYADETSRRYLHFDIQFESGDEPDYPADLRIVVLLRNLCRPLAEVVARSRDLVRELHRIGLVRPHLMDLEFLALIDALNTLDAAAKGG